MPTLDETVAEAERRFPYWNTPSADRDRHRAGYWAFIAGAGWAQNTAAVGDARKPTDSDHTDRSEG